jgi:pyruvate,water dikinase
VPNGFCVTTEAYKRAVGNNEEFYPLLDQLSVQKMEDRETINEISRKIRKLNERVEIEKDMEDNIDRCLFS